MRVFWLLFISSLAFSKEKPTKLNICSITINSNNEIRTVEKKTSKRFFNYTELTALQPKDSKDKEAWFDEACKKNVRCDVLLVSGHHTTYGREFYGDNKENLKLSLQKLMSHSCSKTCEGVLSDPIEVFLFGCNSLNNYCEGAMTERQRQEAYLRLTKQRGMSHDEAEALLESFAHAQVRTVKDEMRDIFRGVQSLFGYSGVAPLGSQVQSYVGDAIDELNGMYKEGYNEHLIKKLMNPAMGNNEIAFFDTVWDKHLKKRYAEDNGHSNFSQTSCYNSVIGEYDEIKEKIRNNNCIIANTKTSLDDKLNLIQKLVNDGEVLYYLPTITQLLVNLKEKKFNEQTRVLYNNIIKNEVFKKSLADGQSLLRAGKTLFDIITLRQKVGDVSYKEAVKLKQQALLTILDVPEIPQADADFICSSVGQSVPFDLKDSDDISFWKKHTKYANGIKALSCLKVYHEELVDEVLENIKKRKLRKLKEEGVKYLKHFYKNDERVRKLFFGVYTGNGDTQERYRAADIYENLLSFIQSNNPEHYNEVLSKTKDLLYNGSYHDRYVVLPVILANIEHFKPILNDMPDALFNTKDTYNLGRLVELLPLLENFGGASDAGMVQLLSSAIKKDTGEDDMLVFPTRLGRDSKLRKSILKHSWGTTQDELIIKFFNLEEIKKLPKEQQELSPSSTNLRKFNNKEYEENLRHGLIEIAKSHPEYNTFEIEIPLYSNLDRAEMFLDVASLIEPDERRKLSRKLYYPMAYPTDSKSRDMSYQKIIDYTMNMDNVEHEDITEIGTFIDTNNNGYLEGQRYNFPEEYINKVTSMDDLVDIFTNARFGKLEQKRIMLNKLIKVDKNNDVHSFKLEYIKGVIFSKQNHYNFTEQEKKSLLLGMSKSELLGRLFYDYVDSDLGDDGLGVYNHDEMYWSLKENLTMNERIQVLKNILNNPSIPKDNGEVSRRIEKFVQDYEAQRNK